MSLKMSSVRLVGMVLVALPPAISRQAAEESTTPGAARYEYRQAHDPNGIGKFYMGREIAYVMGHQAADWLERPEREEEEKTDLLVRSLRIKNDQVIADIGAGTGYFSRRLAPLVGSKGQILAVDVQSEMLDLLT